MEQKSTKKAKRNRILHLVAHCLLAGCFSRPPDRPLTSPYFFAGFSNDLKSICGLERKAAFNPATKTEEPQEPGAVWPSGGAGVLTVAHQCVGRQHRFKKNKQMSHSV